MEEKIIANTSSLIFLGKLNIFYLAKNMFSQILIPFEVSEELFAHEKPESNIIKKELGNFIKEIKIEKITNFNIHKGEKAALSLCLQKGLPFLSDDKKARKLAVSLGIECTGVIGILSWNKENKKINVEEYNNLLKKLIDNGYYITTDLYDKLKK